MPDPIARIGGSGFTMFMFGGKDVELLQTIRTAPPQPVVPAKDLQPLGARTPLEIMTAAAVRSGSVTVSVTDKPNELFWQRLADWLVGANTVVDVLNAQLGRLITCMQVVKTSSGRQLVYVLHGCKITDLDAGGEMIELATLDVPKSFTVKYTDYTVQGVSLS